MLIQFSVANFMSFKEEQTFSMVASSKKELIDSNTFDAPVGDKTKIKLLRAAAIYGPNAAGKTNLLFTLRRIKELVLESAAEQTRGAILPVTPFKLDPESRTAPSKFEVMFIVGKTRYQYGFSATAEHITEEWLYVYPGSRPQRWFTRSRKQNEYEWNFGPSFTGEKKLWRKATRDNALFLSTAVQLNSEQLQPVYDWFKDTLRLVTESGAEYNFSASLCRSEHKNNQDKEDILNFLNAADLGIDDVRVREETLEEKLMAIKSDPDLPEEIKQEVLKLARKQKTYEVETVRRGTDGKPVSFPFDAESSGTQKMFSLAGPWIDALKKGYIICFDELHDNLHPALARFLVRLFNNPEKNPNNAQLIFTTHETALLDQKILRRDQIWFCEKNEIQETQVFSLTDFRPRKERENLETAYLAGRYGALPYIRENQI